jgi:hypothetical protein
MATIGMTELQCMGLLCFPVYLHVVRTARIDAFKGPRLFQIIGADGYPPD